MLHNIKTENRNLVHHVLIQNLEQMRARSSVKVRVSPTLQRHRRRFKLSVLQDARWCCLLEGVGAWADSPFPLQNRNRSTKTTPELSFSAAGF